MRKILLALAVSALISGAAFAEAASVNILSGTPGITQVPPSVRELTLEMQPITGNVTQTINVEMTAPAGSVVRGIVTSINALGQELGSFPVDFLAPEGRTTKLFRPVANDGGPLTEQQMFEALQERFPGFSRQELIQLSGMTISELYALSFPAEEATPIIKYAIIHKDACRSDLTYRVRFIVDLSQVASESFISGLGGFVAHEISINRIPQNRQTLVKPVSEKAVPVFLMKTGTLGTTRMEFRRWSKAGSPKLFRSYKVGKLYFNRDGLFARQYVERSLLNGRRATVELVGPSVDSIYGVCVKMRGREELNNYRR
jgi:hypothetical protein